MSQWDPPFHPSSHSALSFFHLHPGEVARDPPPNECPVCPVQILPFVELLIAKKKKKKKEARMPVNNIEPNISRAAHPFQFFFCTVGGKKTEECTVLRRR